MQSGNRCTVRNSLNDYIVLISAIFIQLLIGTTQLAQSQTETTLHSFGAGDGISPWAGLVIDGKANLYGTTYEGGSLGLGTVFKLDPAGNETVLHSFGSSGDGTYPYASLKLYKSNLYGTTTQGGAFGWGTVFKVGRKGNETVLYSFGSQSGDGHNPYANLIVDIYGNLYGTTASGGAFGIGTVFELTPAGQEIVLYSFGAQSGDGNGPFGDLVMDAQGNLYGTTNGGRSHQQGTVFRLTPTGTETVLHSFAGGSGDGYGPFAGVVLDGRGNLYGTANGGVHGAGIVYEVTSGGKEIVLHSFGSQSGDGQNPYAGLIYKKGNFYGTTVVGGAGSFGTAYKLTPAGTLTTLYAFGSQSGDGWFPYGRLIRDKTGNLYGTTHNGGTYAYGTVFKLTP